MPKTQRVRKNQYGKDQTAKEKRTDTDLQDLNKVVLTAVTARPEQAIASSLVSEPAPRVNPFVSKLSEPQRDEIERLLSDPNGPSYREIAKLKGVTLAAVSHLASMSNMDQGRRLRTYGRRLRKRLPIPQRVDVYRAVVLGEVDGVRPADRLRALERIEALEGIVTAREQRESESNQVHVGPLFVLPALASPVVESVAVDVRPIQDKS